MELYLGTCSFKLSNPSVRIVKGVFQRQSWKPHFKDLNISPLPCLYIFKALVYFKKFKFWVESYYNFIKHKYSPTTKETRDGDRWRSIVFSGATLCNNLLNIFFTITALIKSQVLLLNTFNVQRFPFCTIILFCCVCLHYMWLLIFVIYNVSLYLHVLHWRIEWSHLLYMMSESKCTEYVQSIMIKKTKRVHEWPQLSWWNISFSHRKVVRSRPATAYPDSWRRCSPLGFP